MSDFDDQFTASSMPGLAAAFGDEAAIILPTTTSSTSVEQVDAIAGPERIERRTDQEGRLQMRHVRSVFVESADLASSSIRVSGTATIDDKVYAITHVGNEMGGAYEVQLEAINRAEIARDNYRRRI